MIRTIIIDDEPSAVNVLSLILKKNCADSVAVIATSNCPEEGKEMIEKHNPDLVFLDIEMPGMSGIDLIRSIANPQFRVVFVTAYDAYALDAFRVSALDYLLKPVESTDVVNAIKKIKQDMERTHSPITMQLKQLEKMLQYNNRTEQKVAIGMSDKIVFVNIADILYCEANGAYTNVYLQEGKKMVASKSLGDFETQLSGQKFFRIHHSHLVNLNRVREFQRHDGGYVIMENNKQLEVSQRKRKDFLSAIDGMLV